MIQIVIPVFNRWHFTEACLLSLRNQSYRDFKIIVVDHGSTDGTYEKITNQFPEVVLLKGDESMWWTAATNLGVKYALENNADFVLTLNNDLEVNQNYLSELIIIQKMKKPCIVGSASVYINNPEKISVIGNHWNKYTAKNMANKYKKMPYSSVITKTNVVETDLLSGRGSLFPISVFNEIGLFDEIHFPHYTADEDFSLRCKKAGYPLYYATKAVVMSHVDATGINSFSKKITIKEFLHSLRSIKSSNNLTIRYRWAKKNTPLPYLYFILDSLRVIGSFIKKI